MKLKIAAALALTAASSLHAQAIPDLSTATVLPGNWSFAFGAGGSDATFTDSAGNQQLWMHCTRVTRRLSIAKRATGAAPFLQVWTDSMQRSVPASYNPATGRLTIDVAAQDPLLDAIASSRGRMGFTIPNQPALVVPAWPEAARAIEDCRP
jgi:hypothetical protein